MPRRIANKYMITEMHCLTTDFMIQIYIKSASLYTGRIKKEADNPFFGLSLRALSHNLINLEVKFKNPQYGKKENCCRPRCP